MNENAIAVKGEKETIAPMSSITVVDRKHPLSKLFWTPRNDNKVDQLPRGMVDSITKAGRPEYAPIVWLWKNKAAKNGQELIVIDGNQRVLAAKAAKLDKLPVILKSYSANEVVAISARLNAQRKDNSFITNAMLCERMVRPDVKTGKPTAMSFEDAAQEFGKSHTWVRNHIKALMGFPKSVIDAIEGGKLSWTAAEVALVPKVKSGKEAVQVAFDALMKDGGAITNADGKVKRGARVGDAKKQQQGSHKLKASVWRAIAVSEACGEDFSNLIQVVIGDKSLEWGREQGLDFLVEPKEVKKTKKTKEEKSDGKRIAASSINLDLLSDDSEEEEEVEEVEETELEEEDTEEEEQE